MDIGFIGLGKMGFPMARRLIEVKHQLVVLDTRKEAVDKPVALGRAGGSIAKGDRRRGRNRACQPALPAGFARGCNRS